jgi:ABC-type amino acid transport substrate-binding protein
LIMGKFFKIGLVLTLLGAALMIAPVGAQDDNTVTVGTNAEYPPFESVDADGNIVGFDIDLFNAIAEDAGFEVEYVNTRWDGIFVALSEGEFDAVVSAATINDEREEIVDFSDPYFNAGQTIAVPAGSEIAGVEDLVGLRIGVQAGTTGNDYANEIEGAEVAEYEEITLAFQALGAGDIDAIINDGPTSADIIANNPDLEAVIVGEPLTDEFYGIAINPEEAELLDAVNTSLANLIADGTYAEIFNEWFGQDPPAAFMPEGDGAEAESTAEAAAEADLSSPEGATITLLNAFFTAIATEDPSGIVALACEGAGDSPLFPSAEDLAGFAGLELVSTDGLTFDVTEADGTASVVPAGEIELNVGPLPISMLMTQLGLESLNFAQNEDGDWQVCPAAEGGAEAEATEAAAETDLSSPEGATIALLNAFFTAIATEDPSGIVALACEGAGESPLFPSAEDLAGFAGLELVSTDGLTFDVTEADGTASVVPAGEIELNVGPLPISMLMTQLGLESLNFAQNEDGDWQVCPAAEGAEAEGTEAAAEADLSSPEGATIALLNAFFTAIATEDPSGIVALACEGAGESPLFPSAEDLAGFAGLELVSTDALTFDVTEADGTASVVPAGEIELNVGPLPISMLMTQLGLESLNFAQNEDGDWQVCPAAE